MARVWSSGFELASNTNDMEYGTVVAGSVLSYSTTTVRSGAYALRVQGDGATTSYVRPFIFNSLPTKNLYMRVYFRKVANPASVSRLFNLLTAGTTQLFIRLTATGTLQLFNAAGTQIGSDSAALSDNTWYRIEVNFNNVPSAGSHVASIRLDGTQFASSSTLTYAGGFDNFILGQFGDLVSCDYFFDDLAVNDDTGSFQNSWPGDGKIIRLKPNAAGDSAGFVPQGTLSGTNYGQVAEVTPDDITQYVNSTTLNAEDLYNMSNSGIGASDTVNVVHVGGRFRGNNATGIPGFVFEVEKTGSGTKSASSTITPTSTTWVTNAISFPWNYPLTTYLDPDGAAWTQATLDSMQAGIKLTVDALNRVDVSTVWALVDYTPVVPATPSRPLMMLGVG